MEGQQSQQPQQLSSGSAAAAIASVLGDSQPQLKLQKTDHATVSDLLTKLAEAQQQQMAFMQAQMMQFQQSQLELFTQALNHFTSAQQATSSQTESGVSQPIRSADPTPSSPTELTSIPSELDKVLLHKTRSFKDSVFKLARARSYQKKLQASVDVFDNSDTDYPRSHKPFRSPASFIELDSDFSKAIAGDYELTLIIPRASSRREAMRIVHRTASNFSAMVMLEAQSEHTTSCEQAADPSNLKTLVEEVVEQSSRPELAEDFGLPRPLTTKISKSAIKDRVEQLYAKIYDSLNRKLEADAKAERDSSSAQATNLATVESTSPEELLQQYVKQSVGSELRSHGLIVEDGAMEQPLAADRLVEALQVPKNDASPPAGVGQS